MNYSQQKRSVSARTNEVMLTGKLCCLSTARIDNDDLAPTFKYRFETPWRIRHGHQTAMRNDRVGTNNEQVVCPVDIWHWNARGERATEHQTGLHNFG